MSQMKKILLGISLVFLMFSFASCDFLSTIQAVKGFYEEYNAIRPHYEQSTTVLIAASASVVVKEANFTSSGPTSFDLSLSSNAETNITNVEFSRNGIARKSLLMDMEGLQLEFLIEDTLVTPLMKEDSEIADLIDAFLYSEFQFSIDNINNQLKTGARSYQLDLFLDRFADEKIVNAIIKQFGFNPLKAGTFVNMPGHVKVEFLEVNHGIRLQIFINDQRLELTEDLYAIVSIEANVLIEIPQSVESIEVMVAPYIYKAMDDIRLALKLYRADMSNTLPFTASIPGYMRFELAAGTYQIQSPQLSSISQSTLQDSQGLFIQISSQNQQFTIPEAGVYYLKVISQTTQSVTLTIQKIS
jgi:hypothetical protein